MQPSVKSSETNGECDVALKMKHHGGALKINHHTWKFLLPLEMGT